MTALIWDDIGERKYQTGVDRGVLYLNDGTIVPWNGLIGVDDSPTSDLKSYYLDGIVFSQNLSPGDFAGKLKAYTYPPEFDAVNGMADSGVGLTFHEQKPKAFNLSYRTLIGNDVDGSGHGYKIHILYNVIADPESIGFQTLTDSAVQPIEFSWSLVGTPVNLPGIRPMVHVTIDSTTTDPEILASVEALLYGTDSDAPDLPDILELADLFGRLSPLIITDNGDGTWTATETVDGEYITMLDSTTFSIDPANAVYLDPDTYQISNTLFGFG